MRFFWMVFGILSLAGCAAVPERKDFSEVPPAEAIACEGDSWCWLSWGTRVDDAGREYWAEFSGSQLIGWGRTTFTFRLERSPAASEWLQQKNAFDEATAAWLSRLLGYELHFGYEQYEVGSEKLSTSTMASVRLYEYAPDEVAGFCAEAGADGCDQHLVDDVLNRVWDVFVDERSPWITTALSWLNETMSEWASGVLMARACEAAETSLVEAHVEFPEISRFRVGRIATAAGNVCEDEEDDGCWEFRENATELLLEQIPEEHREQLKGAVESWVSIAETACDLTEAAADEFPEPKPAKDPGYKNNETFCAKGGQAIERAAASLPFMPSFEPAGAFHFNCVGMVSAPEACFLGSQGCLEAMKTLYLEHQLDYLDPNESDGLAVRICEWGKFSCSAARPGSN